WDLSSWMEDLKFPASLFFDSLGMLSESSRLFPYWRIQKANCRNCFSLFHQKRPGTTWYRRPDRTTIESSSARCTIVESSLPAVRERAKKQRKVKQHSRHWRFCASAKAGGRKPSRPRV